MAYFAIAALDPPRVPSSFDHLTQEHRVSWGEPSSYSPDDSDLSQAQPHVGVLASRRSYAVRLGELASWDSG
jgi:hypothetical protein